MFKKIRNRILVLNMSMLSVVVGVAMAAIFVTIYMRVQNENHEKLMLYPSPNIMANAGFFHVQDPILFSAPAPNGAQNNTVIQQNDPSDHAELKGMRVSGVAQRISPGGGLSFSLMVDTDGNVLDVNSVIDWPEDIYHQAAAEVKNDPGDTGVIVLDGRKWQYYVSSTIEFIETEMMSFIISGQYNIIRFLDVTDSYQMLATLAWTLSSLTAAILVVFFFISRFFSNRAVRPMEEAWEKQSRFITDASHELKTPLSVINANCGVLYANSEEPVESQLKWVDSIISSTDRMTGLISGLLSLAQMDDMRQNLQNCAFDLSGTVDGAIREINPIADGKNINITEQIEENVGIVSDMEHIKQVLLILLDNAVKYSDHNGSILVTLKKNPRNVTCAIRNTGEGIPQENLPRVFERFFRGDPARSSENNGYGLGLAIAKDIMENLGAKLTVKSTPGEYTEFTMTFDTKA